MHYLTQKFTYFVRGLFFLENPIQPVQLYALIRETKCREDTLLDHCSVTIPPVSLRTGVKKQQLSMMHACFLGPLAQYITNLLL